MKLNFTNWFTKRKQQTKLSTFTPFPQVHMPDENRDRQSYDHQSILQQSLQAWRTNPLARRIVGLTSQYVVGGGIRIQSGHPRTQSFLDQWWQSELNQCALRVYEWCDELTRSGELFFLLSSDSAGMSYVRAVPAAQIARIETTENDLQQEIRFIGNNLSPFDEEPSWPCYDPGNDLPGSDGPTFRHYEQRQQFFCEMIRQLAQASLNRRALYDRLLDPKANLQVMGADLSARDNASLAIATRAASRTFTDLFDRGLIGEQELLRMVYRFAGEVVNPDLVGKGSPSSARRSPAGSAKVSKDGVNENVINPETGEWRGKE